MFCPEKPSTDLRRPAPNTALALRTRRQTAGTYPRLARFQSECLPQAENRFAEEVPRRGLAVSSNQARVHLDTATIPERGHSCPQRLRASKGLGTGPNAPGFHGLLRT